MGDPAMAAPMGADTTGGTTTPWNAPGSDPATNDRLRALMDTAEGRALTDVDPSNMVSGTYPITPVQRMPLAESVERVESGGRATAVSPKGAYGPMQLMPAAMMDYARAHGLPTDPDSIERMRRDPDISREAGDWYLLKQVRKYGDLDKALAAYNAGPGRVDRTLARTGDDPEAFRAALPAETRGYLQKVRNAGSIDTIPAATSDDDTTITGARSQGATATATPGSSIDIPGLLRAASDPRRQRFMELAQHQPGAGAAMMKIAEGDLAAEDKLMMQALEWGAKGQPALAQAIASRLGSRIDPRIFADPEMSRRVATVMNTLAGQDPAYVANVMKAHLRGVPLAEAMEQAGTPRSWRESYGGRAGVAANRFQLVNRADGSLVRFDKSSGESEVVIPPGRPGQERMRAESAARDAVKNGLIRPEQMPAYMAATERALRGDPEALEALGSLMSTAKPPPAPGFFSRLFGDGAPASPPVAPPTPAPSVAPPSPPVATPPPAPAPAPTPMAPPPAAAPRFPGSPGADMGVGGEMIGGPGAPAGGIPTFTSPTDPGLLALPSGSVFYDSNGQLRAKP